MDEALFRLTDTKSSCSDQSGVNDYKLAFDEIREEQIHEEGQDRKRQRKDKTDAFCDICLMQNLIALSKHAAFYLCYLCEQYLCDKCFKGHESHNYIKLVSEKSERDRQIDSLCDEMRNESDREEQFDREKVAMVDRVNVNHHRLDQNICKISGLCGLNNAMWVVCDNNNNSIKIFNVGSNLLQRYIWSVSKPWDATEIKVKCEPTEQGIMSTSDISVMHQETPDKQCLLAVTLPWTRRIVIINVTQNPAKISKPIITEKRCFSIDFSGDHIYTICSDLEPDGCGGPWFVSVMSTNGVTIKTINTDLHTSYWPYIPHFAVCSGRVYISDPRNYQVLCLNDEGRELFHKTIERSLPYGISLDPDTNQVIICTAIHNKLYRLNYSLESLEPLFDLKSVNSGWPDALCLYRDKLYVSHGQSTHANFVSLIRVL